MALDISDLCQRSTYCARSKGWLDKPRAPEDAINLFISECSEALEDYRANKGLTEIWFDTPDGQHHFRMQFPPPKDNPSVIEGVPLKPCGIPIELADIAIRLAEYCGTHKLDLATAYKKSSTYANDAGRISTLSRLLLVVTELCTLSFVGFEDLLDVEEMGHAFFLIVQFCERNDINLEEAIKMKEAYNLTRPTRHGGKKI